MFYYQSDFEFSQKTKNLILSIYKNKWSKNFLHDADYYALKNIWKLTDIGREIESFLSKFNLTLNYAGVNTFISNHNSTYKTNPHVDILHRNGEFLPIRSRFSIMVLGNPSDTFFWWDHVRYGDESLKKHTFNYWGKEYESLGISGDSVEGRWDYLGKPSLMASNILTPSAFAASMPRTA